MIKNNEKQHNKGFVKFMLLIVVIIISMGYFSFSDPKETDDSYVPEDDAVYTEEDLSSTWKEKIPAYITYTLKKEYVFVKEKGSIFLHWAWDKTKALSGKVVGLFKKDAESEVEEDLPEIAL